MDEESWPERDLWGEPGRPPRDPRGRKRHRYLPQIAEKIAALRGAGATVEEVAVQVHLSEKTLGKYYSRELDQGVALARGQVLAKLYAKSMDGNVSAMKAYLRETERGEALAPAVRRRKVEPKAEPLGKKASLELEAMTAHEGTGWGAILKH